MRYLIQVKPLFPGNSRLPENPEKKIDTDLGAVRIRHREDQGISYHVGMLTTPVRTLKPAPSKSVD